MMKAVRLNFDRLLQMGAIAVLAGSLALVSVPRAWSQDTGGSPQFVDITADAGIEFRLSCGSPENTYIFEAMCGGVAFLDFDNDGWMDIFLLNGTTLEDETMLSSPLSALYRNNGDGTFTNVTKTSGIEKRGWGMGVATADYDGDGWTDLYLTYMTGGVLYRNQGDGSFEDVTDRAGVGNGDRWGTSAAFGDYDGDGYLDLFVANYVQLNLKRLPAFGSSQFCMYRGIAVSCGPRGLLGSRDRLYHNNGDGTFADVGVQLGIDRSGHYGLGVVWVDYDNDGDQDIYVANDSNASDLYRNNGDGTFAEVGLITGVALSADGVAQAGMGVDAGDYDNDGWIDLVKTNFSDDTNNLYRNIEGEMFDDAGGAAGYAAVGRPLLGFGIRFFDYDNDGWKDIFVANGHVNPQVDQYPLGISYKQRNLLYHNLGTGRFAEVGESPGSGLMAAGISRGAATADIDNDGDLDLLVSNLAAGPILYRNDSKNGNWVLLRLVGEGANRDAIGARVELSAGGEKQIGELRRSSSYLSSHDPRMHFGLGGRSRVESLVVRWPDGTVESFEGFEVNKQMTITKGTGETISSVTSD